MTLRITSASISTSTVATKIDVSKVDTGVLWRISEMAFQNRWRMAVAITATLLAGIFQIFVPQFLGQAVDEAQGLLGAAGEVASRASAEDALLTTALLLLGAIGCGLFTMMQNYQGEAVGQLIGYRCASTITASFSN